MAGMDFAINLAAGIAKDCVCGVVQQAQYCYGYTTLLKDLGNEKEKLRSTRESMLVQVRKANANSEETRGGLKQQLEEANNLIEKVEKLEGKAKARKNYYCHGVRPNWISRYYEGKLAAKMMEAVKQLNERIVSQIFFAYRLSLQPMAMDDSTSENFIFFECTKKAHDELLMALKNEEIIRIGLYGMGGCGKTSLVKQMHKAAEDLKLFHKVVYVVVSNHPNVRTIQGSIASWLGLEFKAEENEPERAARLYMTLKNHNRFLIILDDVWEVLRFEDIGIPLGENCKVLLSTRQQQICTLMDCQEVIHLSLLSEGEAWILFQKYAGIIEDTFEDLAREISVECERLPVAIKAVASTLKGKPVVVWEEAMKTLKDCRPLDIERGLENPYKCLQLSFDHLENEEERSLFLLCALFPEDSEIAIEILIRFAFGLGLFEDVDSYERARSRVGAAIIKITNYCLLLQAQEKHVKMHDLVRDVALWIANKQTQVIMGPKQYQKATTEKDYMKDTTKLYCHDMNEFPGQLNCPKLEILFVSIDGGYSSEFPDTFSKEMTELKVLAIKNTSVWTNPTLQLPQSIQGLKKLRTLCLSGWTLDNISILGKLEILVSIELVCCVMNELSRELSDLTKLKLLEISGCRIGGNPYEVLARCSKLEELYFVENILTELVSNDENVPELLHQVGSSTTLQRYHLEIGSSIDILKDDSTSKFISINNFNVSNSNEAIKDMAPKLEVIFLEKIQGDYKNIIPDMISTGGGHMNQLTEFLLRDCDNIECLIDTTNHQSCQAITVFSKLSKLKIEAMKSLEALCHCRPPSGLFRKLEELSVLECNKLHCLVSAGTLNLCHLKFLELEDCPMLTYLFTPSTAHNMVLLEVLKIRDCNELKHIIKEEEDDDITLIRPVFLKLKKVNVKGCEDLKCVIPASFAGGLSELESLEIEDAHELKYVFGTYNHEEDQNQNEPQSIDLPVLKVFRLIYLPNIISICPQNYLITHPSLPKPYIKGCRKLNDIFDTDLEVRQQDGDSSTEELKDASALIEVEKLQQHTRTNKYCCFGNWIWQRGPVENSEIIRSSIPSTRRFFLQEAAKMDQPTQEIDSNVFTRIWSKKHNFYPSSSKNLRRCDTDETTHRYRDISRVESVLETSSLESVYSDEGEEEHMQVEMAVAENPFVGNKFLQPSTASSRGQVDVIDQVKEDNLNERKDMTNNDNASGFNLNKATSAKHHGDNFNLEIGHSDIGAVTSSSTEQHSLAKELVEFRGLFKINARQACLLDEAFTKYPHLWEWKISQKSLRFCKWGYKSLADMLAFLKSETPKAMNSTKMKKFEDLYGELESFGFDKDWLASIRQRVMEMQVDHSDKLKQLAQLESRVRTLQDEMKSAIARMASIKDDLSKLDDVFGL